MAHKNNKRLAPAQLRVLRQIGRAEDCGNYWWHSCSRTDLAIMRKLSVRGYLRQGVTPISTTFRQAIWLLPKGWAAIT